MEKIIAMPSLCDSTSFGLEVEVFNRSVGLKLLKKNPIIVEQLPSTVLYRTGDHINGCFFLWDAEEKLINYYVRYTVKKSKLQGVSVTQTALWRSLIGRDVSNITRHVIYDILLDEYPAIMSDQIQTERGRDFWIDLMSKSLHLGKYDVFLVDFNNHKIHELSSSPELRLWASDDTNNAWAWRSMKHRGFRFMISRKSTFTKDVL